MGKDKPAASQKARTKGNVKPSNSDRAADFLQRNAFAGENIFASSALVDESQVRTSQSISGPIEPQPGAFSSLLPHDQDRLALVLDADFLSVLRRLEKRNSATKKKALDALILLLDDKESKSDDIVSASVLPFWPRLYNNVAYDDDRRVRELAQLAMHSLARRIGRKLGVCLKDVVVSWTFATADSYENTAKAACAGLDDIFPGTKRGDLYRAYAKYLLDECDRRIVFFTTELPVYLKCKKNRHDEDSLSPEVHRHMNAAVQFLAWLSGLLIELSHLPPENPQNLHIRSVLMAIFPVIRGIMAKVKFVPLNTAYYRLLLTTCQSMPEWIAETEEIFNSTVISCVKEMDATPERLAAATVCLAAFGQRIWQEVQWTQLVEDVILPIVEQMQTKAQKQAVFGSLLPLVNQLPFKFTETTSSELAVRLVTTVRHSLLSSLNLPTDTDLSKVSNLPHMVDQGASLDCLRGLMELTRYLLDRSALDGGAEITDFLIDGILLQLLLFGLAFEGTNVTGVRRWMNREQFLGVIFNQVSSTLAHLARDSRRQLQDVFVTLRDGITTHLRTQSCLQTSSLLSFIHHLVESGSSSSSSSSNGGRIDAWCSDWLTSIVEFIRPTAIPTDAIDVSGGGSAGNCANRWLLTFSINGYLSASSVDHPLDVLLTDVLPEFDDSVFIWTASTARGLAHCDLETPISRSVWVRASEKTRANFIHGPIKSILGGEAATSTSASKSLLSLVDLLFTASTRPSFSLIIDFAEVLYSSQCATVQEYLLVSLINQSEAVDHPLLSSIISCLHANARWDLDGAAQLVDCFATSTLDLMWSDQDITSADLGDSGLLAYMKTIGRVKSEDLCARLLEDVFRRLKFLTCPRNSEHLINFLGRLPLDKEASSWEWFTCLEAIMTHILEESTSAEKTPTFIRPEGFEITRIPSLAPLIVCLQTGLRLRLNSAFAVGSSAHKRFAGILLTIQSWLLEGLVEPITLQDICPNAFFLPTLSGDTPSIGGLVSFINGICSELVDAAYSLEDIEHIVGKNSALRAAFARRLIDVHPLKWPQSICKAASCSPPDVWLQEQVTECDPEVFLRLCEVGIPVGMLRRCLPRATIVAYALSLTSKDYLENNKEGLARLLELIAALASTAFVGGSYAITLAPLALEDPVREALVSLEDLEVVGMVAAEPEVLRAILAAMKALQTFIILRQPLESPWLQRTSSRLGLAQMSLLLRQPKPRLTRAQWDSLLCLTASWVAQATARPIAISSLFSLHAFQLVAATGALFVNSLCASTTVTGFLLKRDATRSTTVDQVIDMIREEWDETDFYFADDYDNEDDGTVPEIDFSLFDKADDFADDFADADNEEASFDDPSVHRRLAPPSLIQKDWREFFAGNLFGCLIPLATELCLREGLGAKALRNTPPSVSALCAAVSTCTLDSLLACLHQQPDIVVTYLLETVTADIVSPQMENNLFYSECILAPDVRNVIDLCTRFITSSPYQAGQLLGHTLLTRVVASRSLEPVRRVSDVLVPHMPPSLISVLTSPLPDPIETILTDADAAILKWARGTFTVTQLLDKEDIEASHQRMLSYLLAWDAVVSLLSSASQQSRAGLQAALLADEAWLNHLCRLLLTIGLLLPAQCEINTFLSVPCRLEPDPRILLLPQSSSHSRASRRESPVVGGGAGATSVFAPTDRLVSLPGHRHPPDLSHLAVRLLRRLLAESPALMRALYAELQRGVSFEATMTSGQARQFAGHMERVVRRHFSVELIAAEVEAIERRVEVFKKRLGTAPYLNGELPDAGSVDIRGRPLSREVITTYHFSSDQSLELIIRLPENFPLASVSVEAGHKVGAPTSNWRAWLIHLSVFINNQNGSILEGIGLWLRNLKKKFDGVEDCAICYSVIHDKNFSFPRMQCRVCKKRFHNDCMFRYFQTSRNPKCPMCRSLFYAGAN